MLSPQELEVLASLQARVDANPKYMFVDAYLRDIALLTRKKNNEKLNRDELKQIQKMVDYRENSKKETLDKIQKVLQVYSTVSDRAMTRESYSCVIPNQYQSELVTF